MIDSHCHLDHEPLFSDLKNVIQRSKKIGVKKLLTISTSIESFSRVKEIVNKDEIIFGTIGIHPHEADKNNVNSEFFTKNLNQNKKIIGVGETGLDFYYDNSDRDKQIESFKIHIKAALEANIPLIIHSRNAEEKDVIFQSIGNNEFLKKGSAINKIDILFNKIEKEND